MSTLSRFQEIKPEALSENPFQMIGKDWMLITAGTEESCNTMTASWGGLGVMWGKPVAFVVIRPQRYTKEFVDAGETFSLSFLPNEYQKTLGYLGTVSGRTENKIEKAGLTVAFDSNTPYFEEANTVLLCKKLFAQPYEADSFLYEETKEKWYPNEDYHVLYIAEIEKVLVK